MNKENIRQFIIYFVVGGLATLVEWAFFWLLNAKLRINYLVATAIAFIFSTFANWLFGRLLLFKGGSHKSVWAELAEIYLAAIVGLLLNEGIMFVAVDLIGIKEMLSKMGATGLVFFWNFFIRKLVIYKK